MNRKEMAQAIRKELKENGISAKQVGVTSKSCGYDDAIRCTIKDVNINYELVNKIASQYESISYDQANGEILQGCNVYVQVEFCYDTILEAREKYTNKANELMAEAKNVGENEGITVLDNGNYRIVYFPNVYNPQIILGKYNKEENWCDTIKRYSANCMEGIAEALLILACQNGIDVLAPKVKVVAEVNQEVKETIENNIEEPQTEVSAEQEQQKEENPTETNNNNKSELNVTVSYNQERNGIELKFSEKPSKEILEQIKANGFRWSKFNSIWYCKDSAEKREFLKSIGFISSQENNNSSESNEIQIEVSEAKEFQYPEIDINDIENYTISAELSKRENNNSMFRSKDRNHQEEIQNTFRNWNNSIMELLEGTESQSIIYYAKKKLQSIKKRYFDIYVRMLSHKASSPHWAITGRSGLNVNRYNKKQSQYEKMMGESVSIYNEYEELIKTTKNKIYTEKKQAKKEKIEKILNEQGETITPIKTKKLINASAVENIFNNGNTEVTVYNYNEWDVLKNWGYWRIYKNGQEVSEKCKSLQMAKKLLTYLVAEAQI